jgi:hypothetical protein
MPQVHLRGTRHTVRGDTLALTIQRYTGLGMVQARRVADEVASGKPVSLYVDDFDAVYDLADQLTALGVEAEADESDY